MDFKRVRHILTLVPIKSVNVEAVQDYKYLGIHLDSKLDWSKNMELPYKKAQSQPYFLRRLRSFNISRNTADVLPGSSGQCHLCRGVLGQQD